MMLDTIPTPILSTATLSDTVEPPNKEQVVHPSYNREVVLSSEARTIDLGQ